MLGKSAKSFQRESSPEPFCPCAHVKVSLESLVSRSVMGSSDLNHGPE